MSELNTEIYCGPAIARSIDALAGLRIQVFREWPYLYAGSLEYEARYLQTYVRSQGSIAILHWDGENCVAASTGLPLADAEDAVVTAVTDSGRDPKKLFYFGESVVLASYRGRGLGVTFFEQREAQARALGLETCCFCAVDRPEDHPERPENYVPNDGFWARRGYQCDPQTVANFDWLDIGDAAETRKSMRFWFRNIS